MRPLRVLLAVVLLLVGLLWIGQGTGLVGGSVMTDQPVWAVIGIVFIAAAALLGLTGRRRAAGG